MRRVDGQCARIRGGVRGSIGAMRPVDLPPLLCHSDARGPMKAIKRLLCVAGVLVVAGAAGFWFRPVSYFNEALYVRECISGVENHEVQVAGHRVHYLAEGPAGGPIVVLVHGLGGGAENWRSLAPYLVNADPAGLGAHAEL